MHTSSNTLRALRPLVALAAFAPLAASAQVIFMDFGGGGGSETTESGKSWTNVTGVGTMASSAAMLDYNTNAASGLSYQITNDFQATNGQGAPGAVGEFLANASVDSFYISDSNASAVIVFTGFDPGKQYSFTFLSARNPASDNRSTQFSLVGAGSNSTSLNAAGNTSITTSLFSVTPDAGGTFTLTVTKDAALNDNSSGFAYLNALKIEAVSTIPEPSAAAALLGLGALGLCVLRRKR